jgi:DHA2 family multidrug resistance protein
MIIFGIIFVIVENNHPEPIVDFKFFKNNAFVNTLLNNFIVFMGLMGSIFLVPIFAQTFLGYDATQSGYLFMPLAVAMMLAAPIGGNLVGRVKPKYVIFASTLVAALGMYIFSFIDPRSTALDIIIPLTIMAFGLGFGMAQRTNIIASVVPRHEIGVASSILALARNIAGAFGIAIFGTILNNQIKENVLHISQNSIIHIQNAAQYKQAVGLVVLRAEVSAYGNVFIISSIVVLIGAIASLWINVSKEAMAKARSEEVHVE